MLKCLHSGEWKNFGERTFESEKIFNENRN